jgi:MbtH protein
VSDETEERAFQVLVNDEEQYSLFPAELPVPGGWRRAEFTGTETECVAFVDRVWTDMRPRSLRTADEQR